jgi:hypothetical protein
MNKLAVKLLVFSIFAVWVITACRSKLIEPVLPLPVPSTLTIIDNLEAQERLMQAFEQAYPDKISSVQFLDNDWTMLINGKRFYFANGRLLPEHLRDQWENYHPWDFYEYPWAGTEEQRNTAFNNPLYSVGSSFLFDTLYFSPTEDDSWDLQEKYSFLGVKMLIHPYIKSKLDTISTRIRTAALTDKSINEWIDELQTSPPTFGWNWRSIARTNRRSNHSYGTAIDLLPRDLKGRLTYWQWNSPDSKTAPVYYLPPEIVITIFEEHGFIWGGKWDLIDTMHFEYRPEILLLNNYKQ